MRILSTLLLSLLLAAPAHAQELSEGLLRGLQTELVRQSAFTSARRDISKNYKHAATELGAAIKAGQFAKGFEIYAESVKFEGRIRLERGTQKAPKSLAGRVKGLFGMDTGSAEARQQSYDLQRLVTIFGRNGLLPNRKMEKNALVLFGAHKERLAGRLKPGVAGKSPVFSPRSAPKSSSRSRLRTPSTRSLVQMLRR